MSLVNCEVSAPGKVILHGEHSVVYGKTAIAASLGLRTVTKIEEYEKDGALMFIIVLPKINFRITFSQTMLNEINLEMVKASEPLKMNFSKPNDINHEKYLERVTTFLQNYKMSLGLRLNDIQAQALVMIIYLFRGIVLNNVDNPKSIILTVNSSLAIGAGTGSSASFSVSLAGAMLQYVKYKNVQRYYTAVCRHYVSEDELLEVDQRVLSNAEKDLISDWSFACERIAHGTPSGVDNAACTYGSLVEFKKGEKPKHHDLKVKLKILLVDTKVSRQTKNLVQKVADLKARCPKIVESILEAMENTAVNALQVIKNINNLGDEMETEEDKERNDCYNQLSELFDINHKLLASLGVSHPSLDKIKEISWKFGFCCKITGAGGGGFAIVLIPPQSDDEDLKKLMDALVKEDFDVKIAQVGVTGVKVAI